MPSEKLSRLKKAAESKKTGKTIEKPVAKNETVAKQPAKTDLLRKIIDTVLDDTRLSDYGQAAKVIFAVRKRSDEIESKVKTVKEVVDEEIKRLISAK